jgi:hypothetical protein
MTLFSYVSGPVALRARIAGLCIIVLSCTPSDASRDTASLTVAAARDTAIRRPGLRFNPETIKAGTPVGALLLDSIATQLAAVDSVWVGAARFKGELTLTGRTLRHFEPDVRAVCFEADSASAARMPRWGWR